MINSSETSRRKVLQLGAAGAAALTASRFSSLQARADIPAEDAYQMSIGSELPFLHGVASGDPLPNSVILWTRVTPGPDCLPGSGLGEDVTLLWEVASDPGFATIVKSGTVVASAEHDHTVHVDPMGLESNTVYYYRFTANDGSYAGAVSPIGRTQTAPAEDVDAGQLNFVVASCANYESGFFTAYRDMAYRGQAGDIDFVAFLGDYIYEYATGEYAGKKGIARPHEPRWEITTMQDYRIRYGRYRTDTDLQAAHACAPWVVVWDDHEVADDTWREGAYNHTEGEEGVYEDRRNQALQAYCEWMPMRLTTTDPQGHLYRSIKFGSLMELTMMDLRSYRDMQTDITHYEDAGRTMMGEEQFKWVADKLANSPARWVVMGNSVMIGPMRILTVPGNDFANEALRAVRASVTGFAVNGDQWDGYAAERKLLLAEVGRRKGNTLFITGDIHSEWANSLYSEGVEVAPEVVTTSISAPNVDEIITKYLGMYQPEDNGLSLIVEEVIRSANPTVKHLDYDAHGYALVNLRQDDVDFNYIRVTDVEDPNAGTYLAATKTWVKGQGYTR